MRQYAQSAIRELKLVSFKIAKDRWNSKPKSRIPDDAMCQSFVGRMWCLIMIALSPAIMVKPIVMFGKLLLWCLIRPVRLLRVWVSEGLTQANS